MSYVPDKFSLVFGNLLEALMLERMDQNEAIVARHMGDQQFQRQVAARLAKDAYQRLGGSEARQPTYPPPTKRR